jgi:hypothetical protein
MCVFVFLQNMPPLRSVCTALLLLVVMASSVSSANDSALTCARSCRCLGHWADCRNGAIEDLAGHFGPQTETITLQSYHIETIGASAFSELNLPNFWKLDIVRCGVVTIKKNAFRGLQDLLSLHLDNNEIEVLEPGAFFGLLKLKTLSLQNNKLRTLERGVFGGLDQLNLLNLNRNLLKSLKPNMFEGAHVLTTILVKDNLIENIEASAIGGLNKPVQLYVNRNPLVCSCSLKKEWAALRGSVVGATCSAPSTLAGSRWDVLQKMNCEPVEVN